MTMNSDRSIKLPNSQGREPKIGIKEHESDNKQL